MCQLTKETLDVLFRCLLVDSFILIVSLGFLFLCDLLASLDLPIGQLLLILHLFLEVWEQIIYVGLRWLLMGLGIQVLICGLCHGWHNVLLLWLNRLLIQFLELLLLLIEVGLLFLSLLNLPVVGCWWYKLTIGDGAAYHLLILILRPLHVALLVLNVLSWRIAWYTSSHYSYFYVKLIFN